MIALRAFLIYGIDVASSPRSCLYLHKEVFCKSTMNMYDHDWLLPLTVIIQEVSEGILKGQGHPETCVMGLSVCGT